MMRSAKDNYTKAQAAVIRGRRSVESMRGQVVTRAENMGTDISDWWNNLDMAQMRDTAQRNARG